MVSAAWTRFQEDANIGKAPEDMVRDILDNTIKAKQVEHASTRPVLKGSIPSLGVLLNTHSVKGNTSAGFIPYP